MNLPDELDVELFKLVEELKSKFPGLKNSENKNHALISKIKKANHKKNNSERIPKTKNGYADPHYVINKALANAFAPELNGVESSNEERLHWEEQFNNKINITLTNDDIGILVDALRIKNNFDIAGKFLLDSFGSGLKPEKQLRICAEIMGLKKVGKKSTAHDVDEQCIYFWALLDYGFTPKKASEEVQKKFRHISQPACDKFLRTEIAKKRKDAEQLQKLGVESIFLNVKAPGGSAR